MDNVIHKSYTAGFKLIVVARAEKIGNRAAAREFSVDEKCIRRWRADKEDLQKMPLLKKAQRGGLVAWPDLERELEVWFKNHHSAVSVMEIQNRAKLIAEQMGLTNFKGNINWCYRFIKRKQLNVISQSALKRDCDEHKPSSKSVGADLKLTIVARAETVGNKTAAKEFDVSEDSIARWRLNKDLEKKTLKPVSQIDFDKEKSSFLETIALIVQEEKLTHSQIINVDKIPFSFHFVNGSKGNMSVPVLTVGSEKLSFTCVISCAANGNRLKPFIIFKGKMLPQVNYPADVVTRISEKGALSENLILDWLFEVWHKREGAIFDSRGILIIDSTQRYLFESIKSEYEEMSTKLAVIPKGLKKFLHPMSFLINKTFENEMMKCYERWINNASHSFTRGGKMRKAKPEEIVKWVSESWKAVKVSTITYGFTQAGIISSNVGAESDNSCKSEPCDEFKMEDVNMCESDTEKIKEDLTICKSECKETEVARCSDEYEEIIGVDDFVQSLFASDSDDSESD